MKVIIAGDYCPLSRVATLYENKEFAAVLGDVKSIIENADYSIVNLECPVCYGYGSTIKKCGPSLKCKDCGVEALKWVGFDCVTLANNHFLDYGKEGVKQTLEACEKYGLETVGGGMNFQNASKILYKRIESKILAVINCCEHEFSIATEDTEGSNPLNPIRQYYDIIEARHKADYVIVIVHGGNEYYQLPSPRMKETYRFFIDAGADAVVNHHQHCYSGYEMYKGKPIVYGLGNFCFEALGDYDLSWNEGYLAELNFEEQTSLVTIPYVQCNHEPIVRRMDLRERKMFDDTISKLNSRINNDDELRSCYTSFVEQFKTLVEIKLSPYSSRIGQSLCRRKILPSFVSDKRKIELLNYLMCESHFPKVISYLTTE
jgi:poly-gamma-glutamate synthesis protein (capsule biosynthesis protein)